MDTLPSRSRLDADAYSLRSLLLEDVRAIGLKPHNPKLLMLAGLPGAGKSTFARALTACHPLLVLESDRMRKTLVDQPQYTADEHSRVFRACHRLIGEFIGQGYQVLLDATNLGQRNRRPVIAISRKYNVPIATVVVTAPPDVVKERLLNREAGMDPDTWSDAGVDIYTRMAPAWQPVKRDHFSVDTSRDFTPILHQVVAWAKS